MGSKTYMLPSCMHHTRPYSVLPLITCSVRCSYLKKLDPVCICFLTARYRNSMKYSAVMILEFMQVRIKDLALQSEEARVDALQTPKGIKGCLGGGGGGHYSMSTLLSWEGVHLL